MNAFQLPPIPSWEGLHPLVVHFPIALLLIAPRFVLAAMVMRQRGRLLAVAGLTLMVIGTAFAFVAKESGEAAGELVDASDSVQAVLERHENLAELTVPLFASLTAAYAVLLSLQWWFLRLRAAAIHFPLHGVFLLAFMVSCVVLANTAHQGGRLVHEFGVRAFVGPTSK